jgi:excisionase family DNA binding protein
MSRKAQKIAETYTVEEAAERLGISRGAAYEAVKRGEIPSRRFGRSIRVPRKAFQRMLGDDDE